MFLVSFSAHTEKANNDVEKVEFCEFLEEQLGKLPVNYIKIILGNVNSKKGRERLVEVTVGTESLHQ